MTTLSKVLLIFHFLGLAMGFAGSIASAVVFGLMSKAEAADRGVLARVPPAMGRVGSYGLLLLWVTGIALVFSRFGGFGAMPGLFHAKLTVVVILTLVVGALHGFAAKARRGDTAAAARLPLLGRIGLLAAIVAVILAVLTFE